MTESSAAKDGIENVLALYWNASFFTRAFLKGRTLLSDLPFIERQVPPAGTVVDLGCGHGLFSNLMALKSGGRQVTGVDLDAAKIEIAQKTVGSRKNIGFVCGDVTRLEMPVCDVITIVDVTYLLTPAEQQSLLEACAGMLTAGGLLVWKAQERRPFWKYAWTYAQEMLVTSVGLTRGRKGKMYFLAREDAERALEDAGFEPPRSLEMRSWRPYPDVLYLAKRR